MEVTTHNTKETQKLAKQLAKNIKPNDILLLYGDLGSGKTTFTRYLTKALAFNTRVQSPTFVIARRYSKPEGDIKVINHIDLYRVTTKEGVEDLGLKELFDESDSVTIIEWPDILDKLPKNSIKIFFDYLDENSRKIRIDE